VIQEKKAFTLFELMVVVMIIGIVYALVLGRFNPKQHIKIVQLASLRDILTQKHKEGQRLDLILYDKCQKATLFINNEKQEKMDINLKPRLFEGIKVYKSDPFGHERKISFTPVIIEDKIEKKGKQMTQRKDLDLEHFKRLLLTDRERLEKELAGIDKEFDALESSASEAEDAGDVSVIDYQNEVDRDQVERIRRELAEIDHALAKIREGGYGICEKTAQPIPVERLEAYPAARTLAEAE